MQLPPNDTETSAINLAQVDTGVEVELIAGTNDAEIAVAALESTIKSQTETLANQ